MRISLFDHVVTRQSPAGSCDLRILEGLCSEHDFTVFASELSVSDRDSRVISHVAVPAVHRPALAAYLMYFAGSCIAYAGHRLKGGRFDLLHVTDCAFPIADLCYAHFCHKAFLSEVWPQVKGPSSPRRLHAWASHKVRALIEARLVRRSRVIVVPSNGLKRDISRVYPGTSQKITVIQNTVDVEGFYPPHGFDRRQIRARMNTDEAQTAFVFVALGHFERKGLPLLLDALASGDPLLEPARLWVVGGEQDLVESYRRTAGRLGVGDKVMFTGRTDDVRPFLWSADAFVGPSHYEAFSLGLLEGAAAGLPLIVTRISGSDELLIDSVNGFEVDRTGVGVAAGLKRFLALDAEGRRRMRRAAHESVDPLRPERFVAAWRALYASLAP